MKRPLTLKETRLSAKPKQSAKEDSYVVEITLNKKTDLGVLPGPRQRWGLGARI